jgi:hypothetical protein
MRSDSRSVPLSILAGSLGLWLICVLWVVPAMIESAYHGESWSFLNRMIRGQATHPVAQYVHDWYRVAAKLTIAGLVSGLAFWLVALVINRPALVRWIRIVYKAVAILTLNTLVLLVCFEVAAIGLLKIWSVLPRPTEPLVGEGDAREKVSYYSSQDWAERYWYEMRLSRTQRYHPYVGWRRAPFNGKTIDIDQNGIRATPGADCRANSFKVFTFGESTMWGTGSPNWGTIPANLQKGLEKLRPGPICVTNFAESAYVTTQDVITLQMQLRSGNVPDVVVFYGLSGDIGSAYESGRVGIHANFNDIAARFQGRREPLTFVDRLRSTSAYSLIDQLVGKLTITNPQQKTPIPFEMVTYESREIDVPKLSELVVQDYFANYEIVRALAQKYGFKYFFFVPPVVTLGNKPLTSEEQEMKHVMASHVALDKLLTAAYQNVEGASSRYQNLYSMVHIFDHYDSLIFIDGSHVTPIGNQLIAQKMLDVMHVSPE